MKLMTLNIWGGEVGKPLFDFFETHKNDVDIFCLQEVFKDLGNGSIDDSIHVADTHAHEHVYNRIESILTDHNGFFCPVKGETYGLACFVKKDISVVQTGDVVIYDNPQFDASNPESDHTRKMQWFEVSTGDERYVVMNVHGHWVRACRKDSPERILQSKAILEFVKGAQNKKLILCGDFNLLPTTESIHILEKDFRNLITDYGITSTRTSVFPWPEKYADYVFVSPQIKEISFKVLPDEVSDHSPLLLEF